MLSFFTDHFLSPTNLEAAIDKHFKQSKHILTGHSYSDPRELLASMLTILYSEEAQATLLEMKNSSLTIREWALRNILPLLEHKKSIAEQNGPEAKPWPNSTLRQSPI